MAGGSGITLKETVSADIPTPGADKATIFLDPTQGPSYKDDTGTTYELAGPTGAAGTIGPPGYGFDGDDGDPPIAMPGPQGNPGATGASGATGATGPAGPALVMMDDHDYESSNAPLTPISGGGSVLAAYDIKAIYADITDAEMRSLNTVPKTINVPAPASNELISPIGFTVVFELTGTFSASSNMNVRPVGGTSNLFTAQALVLNSTLAKKLSQPTLAGAQNSINLTTTAALGVQWEIFGSAAITGGSTTNGFRIYILYRVLTLP